MLKRTLITIALSTSLINMACATDLLQVYQQAEKNDSTYQAAAAQYAAAKMNLPIAIATLLPSVTLTANTTFNKASPVAAGNPSSYNSNGYELSITQPLLNLTALGVFAETRVNVAIAAVAYTQAQQQLITNVATAYFAVLENQEKLNYANTYQQSLEQQLNQTEQQYKVGLKALTDVQSTKASYESAVASSVSAENALQNAYEQLTVITGVPEKDLAILSSTAPLLKPDPANQDKWVDAALTGNLDFQTAQLQNKLGSLGIKVAIVGDGTIPGYAPTLNAVGTDTYSKTHDVPLGTPTTSSRTETGALQLSYPLFNGGSTYFNVKKSQYTAQTDEFNLEQTRRNTVSNTRQAYLNVLSDISQVEAYKQAVISNQSSLEAITAAYNVGTRTIVDLLTQQSNLFNSEQQYATARYQYINDSLNLKAQAGVLSPADITEINKWLVPAGSQPSAYMSSLPQAPMIPAAAPANTTTQTPSPGTPITPTTTPTASSTGNLQAMGNTSISLKPLNDTSVPQVKNAPGAPQNRVPGQDLNKPSTSQPTQKTASATTMSGS